MSDSDQSWLVDFLRHHGGAAGSVHRVRGEALELTATDHIPPPVTEIIRVVPRGKGMAGLAFEQNEAVSTCNIQTDDTGVVRPGAKMVGARAGVALPVRNATGEVRAVVGIAYAEEKTLKESELAALMSAAASLA